MISLNIGPGVSLETRFTVRLFRFAIPEIIRIEHPLPIMVCDAPAVATPTGYGFGVFQVHRNKCEIFIAGSLLDEHDKPLEQAENAEQVLQSLAHELAHYEQWRDGRNLTERGVAVRARGILRAFKRHPLVVETVEVLKAHG